jgi:hypothetical protein
VCEDCQKFVWNFGSLSEVFKKFVQKKNDFEIISYSPDLSYNEASRETRTSIAPTLLKKLALFDALVAYLI